MTILYRFVFQQVTHPSTLLPGGEEILGAELFLVWMRNGSRCGCNSFQVNFRMPGLNRVDTRPRGLIFVYRSRPGVGIMPDSIEVQIRRKMESRGIESATTESFLDMVQQIRGDVRSYVSVSRVAAPDANLLLEVPSDEETVTELRQRGMFAFVQRGGDQAERWTIVPPWVVRSQRGFSKPRMDYRTWR